MLILGIETSTRSGSVALLKDEKIVSEFMLNVDTTHSSRLLSAIDAMLKFSNIKTYDLNAIAVAIGPGSFTGLRIGISTAEGFAHALKIPIIGIPTLEVLAHNISSIHDGYICSMLTARKDEVYALVYFSDGKNLTLKEILPCSAIKIENLLGFLKENCMNDKIFFIGDGIEVFKNTIVTSLGEKARFVPDFLNSVRASVLASLVKERFITENYSIKNIIPIYCRNEEDEFRKKSSC